jgi:prepilin-type N-terminal cleavage/methylation domain-containing protein
MRQARRLSDNRAGYSVMEIIIVVALLGILAAVAFPLLLGGIQRSGVDGASRQLAQDIRLTQSTAITRGLYVRLVAFDNTGNVPSPANLSDATKANKYRLEMSTALTGPWPATTDVPATNDTVLTSWYTLASGVRITSGNALTFNSQGFLRNTSDPLNIVLEGPGGTKTVQTTLIGKATIQ